MEGAESAEGNREGSSPVPGEGETTERQSEPGKQQQPDGQETEVKPGGGGGGGGGRHHKPKKK